MAVDDDDDRNDLQDDDTSLSVNRWTLGTPDGGGPALNVTNVDMLDSMFTEDDMLDSSTGPLLVPSGSVRQRSSSHRDREAIATFSPTLIHLDHDTDDEDADESLEQSPLPGSFEEKDHSFQRLASSTSSKLFDLDVNDELPAEAEDPYLDVNESESATSRRGSTNSGPEWMRRSSRRSSRRKSSRYSQVEEFQPGDMSA